MSRQSKGLTVELCSLKEDKRGETSSRSVQPMIWYRTAVAVGHRAFIPCSASFGGRATRQPAILTVDLNRNVWQCDPMNGPCSRLGRCFLFGEKILWFGADDYQGERKLPRMMRVSMYDLILKEWSNYPLVGSPLSDLYGFSGDFFEHRNVFVVFGGQKPGRRCVNDVNVLDLASKRWVRPVVKGNPPKERFFHGTCVHNRVLYLYGGIAADNFRFSDGIFLLHLSMANAVTWSKPKILFQVPLFKMSSFPFFSYQGKLILCGGKGDLHDKMRVYDPKSRKVSSVLPETPADHEGYGYGTSAIPIGGSNAVALFGRNGSCNHYHRISGSV